MTSRYRNRLPQLDGRPFITDGGLETTLIYHAGIDLPHFAAFVLLDRPEHEAKLFDYFASYADIGRAHGAGVVLESATWRANPDWAAKLGYDAAALADLDFRFAHEPHIVEHHRAAAPWLVPVISDAPHILRGFGIIENCADALKDQVTVVIPCDDLLVAQSSPPHCRAEEVFQ